MIDLKPVENSEGSALDRFVCVSNKRLGVRRDINSTKSSMGREPDDWKP